MENIPSAEFIRGKKFITTKQGNCSVVEVNGFLDSVAKRYDELYRRYSDLEKKLVRLTEEVENSRKIVYKYNTCKDQITDAVISAETYCERRKREADEKAESVISKAESEAEEHYSERKKAADSYYDKKIKEADEYYQKAETVHDGALKAAKAEAEAYINKINGEAAELIKKANENAGKIVAKAYADAQKAKQTADETIENAEKALPKIQYQFSSFKDEIMSALAAVEEKVNAVALPDKIDFVPDEDEQFSELTLENNEPLSFEYNESDSSGITQDDEQSVQYDADESHDSESYDESSYQPPDDEEDNGIFSNPVDDFFSKLMYSRTSQETKDDTELYSKSSASDKEPEENAKSGNAAPISKSNMERLERMKRTFVTEDVTEDDTFSSL